MNLRDGQRRVRWEPCSGMPTDPWCGDFRFISLEWGAAEIYLPFSGTHGAVKGNLRISFPEVAAFRTYWDGDAVPSLPKTLEEARWRYPIIANSDGSRERTSTRHGLLLRILVDPGGTTPFVRQSAESTLWHVVKSPPSGSETQQVEPPSEVVKDNDSPVPRFITYVMPYLILLNFHAFDPLPQAE